MFITFGGADLDLAREHRQQIAWEVRINRLVRCLRSAREESARGRRRWAVGSPSRRVGEFLPRVGARYGSR